MINKEQIELMFIFILMAMIFCHIVDDYYLQGWLASAKQKSWWEKNAPDSLYQNDYKMALICHGCSWSFMTLLPISLYILFDLKENIWFVFVGIFFIANAITHTIIDNEKANKHTINLITDQLMHLIQILFTWSAFIIIYLI